MKITIENFLAFSEPVTFDLKKINLFIGANNCGKSTFAKLIEILQHSRYEKGTGSISLSIPKTLNAEISCFNDLQNQSLQDQKLIKSKFEIQFEENNYIIEIHFKENNKYHLDNYGKKFGGNGEIVHFQLNEKEIIYSSEDKTVFSYSGFKYFENSHHFFDSEEYLLSNYSSREMLKYFFENWDEDKILWEATDTLNCNNSRSIRPGFVVQFKNLILQIVQNEIDKFGIISSNNNTTELYQLERQWVDNELKNTFGIEIIEKEFYLKSKNSKKESDYVNTELFFKTHNSETNLDGMGLGFQNLIKILMTKHGEGFHRHYKLTQFFPIIQEPEIGLHPDWQIDLLKLLINDCAIIETHSLVLLRALQLEVAKGNFQTNEVLIHNFYRDNGIIKINPIRIEKTGILDGEFKNGFQNCLLELEMELWKIQQAQINKN